MVGFCGPFLCWNVCQAWLETACTQPRQVVQAEYMPCHSKVSPAWYHAASLPVGRRVNSWVTDTVSIGRQPWVGSMPFSIRGSVRWCGFAVLLRGCLWHRQQPAGLLGAQLSNQPCSQPSCSAGAPATTAGGSTAGAAGWVGVRTVAELRRELGAGAPRNSDSLYREIERAPRKFNPLKIPKTLQVGAGLGLTSLAGLGGGCG